MKKIFAIIGTVIALACASTQAQVQTLVVTPQNTNSAVVNIKSNSFVIFNSADSDDGGQLVLGIQGTNFVINFAETSVTGLTIVRFL